MEIRTAEVTSVTETPVAPADSTESQFTQDELHTRLVMPREDNNPLEAGSAREIVEIVDNRALVVRGVRLVLTELKTFIFNIHHLQQGETVTATDIAEAGFRGARATCRRATLELCQKLTEVSDGPIIERQQNKGRTTSKLLPDVKIIDKRQELTDEQKREQFLRDRIMFDEAGKAIVGEDGVVLFKGPTARREVTRLMIERFEIFARADTRLFKMLAQTGKLQPRSTKLPLMPLGTAIFTTYADEWPLLASKEAALRAFVSRFDDKHTPAEQQQIIDGIHAVYDLFRININMPSRIAKAFHGGPYLPYEDIYQECALDLFEGILGQPYDSTGAYWFSFMVSTRMKEKVPGRVRRQYASLSHGWDAEANLFHIARVIHAYEEQYSESPSNRTIAAQTGMELDEVEALLGMRVRPTEILSHTHEVKADSSLVVRDFVDEELDRQDRAEAMDTLFTSDALASNEKIVLSMGYRVFHPSLRGAELRIKGRTTFTYPYNEADLLAITRARTFDKLITEILKLPSSTGYDIRDRGLHKSRKLLIDCPGLTDYKTQVEQEEAYFEEQRRKLIAAALELSSDKPLGIKEVRFYYAQGKFASEQELYELFDTLADFQRACGFSPHKTRVNRGMTPGQIVALALDIKSSGPLTTPEIRRLSKEGEFVSMSAIYSNFGSVPNFHAACGFTA